MLKHNAEVMRSKANRLKGYLPLVHVRSLDCSTFAFVLTHFLTSGFFDARENSYVRRIENERRTFCPASRFGLITGFERRIFLRASRKQPVRKENHTNADVEHSYVHVRVKRKLPLKKSFNMNLFPRTYILYQDFSSALFFHLETMVIDRSSAVC